MTTKQRIHLLAELWPAAAAVLGCSPNDRERRLEEISKALGRPVDSASEIKTNKDFDDVKKHLLAISQPANLNDQVRIANMPRTRLIVGIMERRDRLGVEPFSTIIRERFGTVNWEDLPDWQLEQLRDTLAARVHSRARIEKANAEVPEELQPF